MKKLEALPIPKMDNLYCIGIDEAGRGSLAGPVTAAACMLPLDFKTDGIFDSKIYSSEKQRESAYHRIVNTSSSVKWSVTSIEAKEIDSIGIRPATLKAMVESAENVIKSIISENPDARFAVFVDGNECPQALKANSFVKHYESVIKGDSKLAPIAAASVIAKVTRDRFMNQLHEEYPEYNFLSNKGYGTKMHRQLISVEKHTPVHRRTFDPLKSLLGS